MATTHMALDPVARLTRDIAKSSGSLSKDEARFLVDAYYQMQHNRIMAGNQTRALNESGEPHDVLVWLGTQNDVLEQQVKRALDRWTDEHPVGRWLKAITGIGPVIAAGLLAHIDIEKAPTVGHIWRFAGLDPTLQWSKGQKRPHNGALKTLCWKIGESFVKVSSNSGDVYGKVYLARKEYEQANNENGSYAGQALDVLAKKRIGKETDAYKSYSAGKLPPAHIHARAKRYAVKLFLSHLHEFWYEHHFGEKPPLPYPIAILGHAHKF
jgi:hypothetical protein